MLRFQNITFIRYSVSKTLLPFSDCFWLNLTDFGCVMSEAPLDARCTKFADYLTDKYVTQESRFPPSLWAEPPSDARRTTNGSESFHSHYNAQFYSSHPSIFLYIRMPFCKYKLLTTSRLYTFQMLHHIQEMRRRNFTFCWLVEEVPVRAQKGATLRRKCPMKWRKWGTPTYIAWAGAVVRFIKQMKINSGGNNNAKWF